jgi:hypothetical protein
MQQLSEISEDLEYSKQFYEFYGVYKITEFDAELNLEFNDVIRPVSAPPEEFYSVGTGGAGAGGEGGPPTLVDVSTTNFSQIPGFSAAVASGGAGAVGAGAGAGGAAAAAEKPAPWAGGIWNVKQ